MKWLYLATPLLIMAFALFGSITTILWCLGIIEIKRKNKQ